MKALKRVSLMFIAFVFILGCSGDYGILRRQTPTDIKMTLAELRKNWEDYHLYYGTRGGRPRPQGIMFDPKNNDTRLIGDSWIKIADQPSLSEAISAIQYDYDNANVEIIEGPDGRFFGYIYTPILVGDVKVVDEQTLYIGPMAAWGSAP